jgi:hypothetical protein
MAQHGNHGRDMREAIPFCISGVSRQIARTGADGEIHIQHIAREKEQRRKIPPRIRQRLGDFSGLMVFRLQEVSDNRTAETVSQLGAHNIFVSLIHLSAFAAT